MGIEAMMRGAQSAVFIELSHSAVRSIQENLRRSGFENTGRDRWVDEEGKSAIVISGDFFKQVIHEPPITTVDLWFIDPPWATISFPRVAEAIGASPWCSPGGLVVLEHPSRISVDPPLNFEAVDRRAYGDTAFTFWRRNEHAYPG